MNRKVQAARYIIADLLSAAIAWTAFYIFRKLRIEPIKYGYEVPVEFDGQFYLGLALIPVFWLTLYLLTGTYRDIYRKSRLQEMAQTMMITFIGVLFIFFTLLLDDEIASYRNYYQSFFGLYVIHFCITFLFRFTITSIAAHRIKNRIIGFNTILVGSNRKAFNLYSEMSAQKHSSGNRFVGFVHVNLAGGQPNGNGDHLLDGMLPHLGGVDSIRELIDLHKVEEVVIAIESSEHDSIRKIMDRIEGKGLIVKIIPDMYDILAGSVKMTSIFGAPLIEIYPDLMPHWQKVLKRTMDIGVSLAVFTAGMPVFLITTLSVKLSSRGPVLYSHERIGLHGKPFAIFKFRSMYVDAEGERPMLSSSRDDRITPFGRFMRKIRLDEVPQFYNVLIGDMSLVGPRPERQFFIDQIIERGGHYHHLHKVRPGITSWGQVKYGYAENVEQMLERLKFDIIYIENMSLSLDLKILAYTILTVLQGRGK